MSHQITIVGKLPRHQPKTFVARIGETIRTSPQGIARYCVKSLAPVGEDIATIVESFALADRLQTRRRAEGWSRQIALEIPVFEFEVLSNPTVVEALLDVAAYLTGDDWAVSFLKRTDLPVTEHYLPLAPVRPKYVVPYSNGLDSFAQAKLLQHEHGDDAVLALRAGKLQFGAETDRPLLVVPRRFYANHPRERTYRTRPLVYFSLAALGAATVGASSIVIGENGQGALGPSLARFSDEWPFRSTHPGFVKRLEKFLNAVMGTSLEFQQPQLWRTKAEVLMDLANAGQQSGWQDTISCSMRPLQRDLRRACGLCGGCLLRRTALHNAGYPVETDVMFRLEEGGLFFVRRDGHRVPLSVNAREILLRSSMSMAAFADVRKRSDADARINWMAREIPGEVSSEVSMRITSLIGRHSNEWNALLESLPAAAWLRGEFEDL